MPNIRILVWNIEKLSTNKLHATDMANHIGKVIAGSNADVIILLEVVWGTSQAAMTLVANAAQAAANTAAAALGNLADPDLYTGWLLSYQTGGECYGLLIRDLNLVRPVQVTAGPTGADVGDGPNAALSNLDMNQFATWPAPFLGPNGNLNVYPLAAGVNAPTLPLIDTYSVSPPARAAKRRRFGGRTLKTKGQGYALGRGFRMPCLIMLSILNDASNAIYLVPVLVCHLGAVRSGTNRLGRAQMMQYKETHIAQKFQNQPNLALPNGGYICLDGGNQAVQELIVTGDFNVDFLKNQPLPHPPPPQRRRGAKLAADNRAAFNTLTPNQAGAGSAAPPAAPGAPGPPPVGNPPPPYVEPAGGWPQGPSYRDINNLALKPGATTMGTILRHYRAGHVPATLLDLRGACFDNFFFGGTNLSATYQTLTPLAPPSPAAPGDACQVIDLPSQIVQANAAGVNLQQLDVSGTQVYYANRVKHHAADAPALAPAAMAGALTTNDSLIGARFISDHLPMVVQFNLA